MANLLLSDLKLVLDDMLTKRKKAVLASHVGNKVYAKQLEDARKAIHALPAKLVTPVDTDDRLRATDALHDAHGRAIFYLTEAYVHAPAASPVIKAASARVRAFFIPKLAELQDDFVTEADRAAKRKKSIAEIEADLKTIPVAGGGTLHDWASEFVSHGITLSELLSAKAQSAAPKNGSRAGRSSAHVRTKTLGLLKRFRIALRDEIAANPKLAKNETGVFGYYDELAARRAGKTKTAKKKGAKDGSKQPAAAAPAAG
jgi:hypothetical protein